MNIFQKITNVCTRGRIANVCMVLFVVGTTAGASMLSLPIGLIVGGVVCGLYGYLLGSN